MNELLAKTPERKLWYEGPNYTADAVIIDPRAAQIRLIQRTDTDEWALPGGFMDPSDMSSSETAIREAKEETGLELTGDAPLIFRGAVNDPRNSETSWIETSAHLFVAPNTLEGRAGDDARETAWHDLASLPPLYASHRQILERALDYLDGERLFEILESPETETPVEGGYMQYDKYIAEKNGKRAFVKASPIGHPRSEELLRYIEKEAGVMSHLRQSGFRHLPEQSALRGNQLVMDAIRQGDGWLWQTDQDTVNTYIRDTLAAFAELEKVPLPSDTCNVEPSYESIIDEGWQILDDEAFTRLKEKAQGYVPNLTPESQKNADQLFEDIPMLHGLAATAPVPERFVFCHHDIRQSNLAWHPENGVKIIDWSWASPGLPGTDATALLIDLHKNGYDVSEYRDSINPQHCLNLLGFWLFRSSLPEYRASGLREQQFTAAISAYELLQVSLRT